MPEKDHRDIVIERVAKEMGVTVGGSMDFCHKVIDEYFEERGMELLKYMATNEVECRETSDGKALFYYKKEWLTEEQLFKNFL